MAAPFFFARHDRFRAVVCALRSEHGPESGRFTSATLASTRMNTLLATITSRPALACGLAALVPASSVLPASWFAFAPALGIYAAAGLLAILWRDYSRHTRRRRSRLQPRVFQETAAPVCPPTYV
jgi:hypothetical protein